MRQITRTESVSHIKQYILDCFVVSIILIVALVYTSDIEQVIDIGLYDETCYLHRGLLIPTGFPSAEKAPLYALWYYMLSLLQHDAVELYFLNFKIMTVLPVIMLYLATRAYRVSRILSLALSLVFLFSAANFPTWPKVSHFAVVLLLCGFLLSSRFRDSRLQTCTLIFSTLLASYVRPELFISFIGITIVLLFISVIRLSCTRSFRTIVPLIVTLSPCIILIFSLGCPLRSSEKAMVAFGQHYAANWVDWHNDERDPWTNWQEILAEDFSDANSPGDAFLINPSAIGRHIVQNLRNCPYRLVSMFGLMYPPSSITQVALNLGIIIVATFGMLYVWKPRTTVPKDSLFENWGILRLRILLLLIVVIPVVISIIFIAPRHHYLFIFGTIIIFGLVILLFRGTLQFEGYSSYSVLAVLCFLPLVGTRPLSCSIGISNQPNLKTIKYLRTLEIAVPIEMLEADGGYNVYLGNNFSRVAEYEKSTSFGNFLTESSIDLIVVSERLSKDIRFSKDPEWRSFTDNPSLFGFMQITIPAVEGRTLFIKEEINPTPSSRE